MFAGLVYLVFHFYAMGVNPQNVNLHIYIPQLDKIEHFTAGAIIAGLIIGLNEKLHISINNPSKILVTVFCMAITFEILEYYTPYWGGYIDTILDILFALLGASITIAVCR